LLEDAIELLDDPALRARAQAALAVELIFVGDTRRFALLDQALAVARSSGDPLALVDTAHARFNARSRATWFGADQVAEHDLHFERLAAAEALDDPFWLTTALMGGGFHAMATCDGPAVRDAVEGLHRLAARFDTPGVRGGRLMVEQMFNAIVGDLVVAEAMSAEFYALNSAMGIPEAFTYRATMGLAGRREQDRLAELLPGWLAAPAADSREPNPTNAAVMFMLAACGDLDDAATRLERVSGQAFADAADDAGWPMAIGMLAETAALVGDRQAAAALVPILAPFAADGSLIMTGGIVGGPAARLLALLEWVLDDRAASEVHFAAAIEDAERLESPLWRARCRLDWAERLLARGEEERGATLIAEADAAMGDLELPALRRQLAELRA
jgi:hypothetical protein